MARWQILKIHSQQRLLVPAMPIKMPANCIQFELNLSQSIDITNENRGVVPFRTDIVPAFKSRAAFENR